MQEFTLRDEYIKLVQLLKAAGIAESGVDAKDMIVDGLVRVNGEVDLRRGRKVYPGDEVEVGNEIIKVAK